MPRVSVVIPTYNCGLYIKECIDSVLNQSFPDFEIIVVNDGSLDNTEELLKPYMNYITYLCQKNMGVSISRNGGIKLARGEWIAFADADDVWTKEKLDIQMAYLAKNPNVGLLHSSITIIDKGGRLINQDPLTHNFRSRNTMCDFLIANRIALSTVLVKRDLVLENGLFNETLRTAEDYDLWLRMLRSCQFAYLAIPLVKYRVHDEQQTKKRLIATIEHLQLMIKNRKLVRTFNEWLAWNSSIARHYEYRAFILEKYTVNYKDSLSNHFLSFTHWPYYHLVSKLKGIMRCGLLSLRALSKKSQSQL